MIYFNSDYLEGAHSAIMARLAETNMMPVSYTHLTLPTNREV